VSRAAPDVIRRQAPFLAALLFGLLAAGPLLANAGFLLTRGGGDSPFLLQRLHELLAALAGGQLPARWMPNADYGFGYPFFNYYAALPYYLAALFHVYGFSYVASLKLTQLAALLVAAGGAYGWARSLGLSRAQAVLAAAAYSFAPFHLVNLYVRGDSLSELWAMSFYPLVLWSAARCLAAPRLGRAVTLAVCVALLVLSHNISALNFMPFVGLYLLLGAAALLRRPGGQPPARARLPLLVGLAALAGGLALSAFFWLPALRETSAVQLADVTQGYFFYGNHFLAGDLVQRSLFFSAETGAGQPNPFSMSLAQAVVTALGLLAMVIRAMRARRWTVTDTFLLLGLGLATFMMTPASAWLWANLPLLRFAQFPWRFLSIQALFAAAISAQIVPSDAASGTRTGRIVRWGLALGIGLALAVTTLGRLRPDFVPLSDADVTAQRLDLLEYFSANIGSTIGFEYLPRGVDPRPYSSDAVLGRPPRLKVLRGQASGSQAWQSGAAQAWTVTANGGPATVAVPIDDWPGWTATVDGAGADVGAAPGLGWISLDVPQGTHAVVLELGSTPTRDVANVISLVALVLPLEIVVQRLRRRQASPASGGAPARAGGPTLKVPKSLGAIVLAGVGLLAAGAVLLRVIPATASSLPLSIDFAQLTYLQRDVIRFEGGTQLVGVSYSADHLARGQTLAIETTWQPASAGRMALSLVPASNLLDPAPVQLVTASAPVGAAGPVKISSALAVPSDIPPGVYFVTVQWSDAAGSRFALTGAGRQRGLVNLAPVWIDDPGPAVPAGAPLAEFGPGIALLNARTSTPVPGVLQLNLSWQARQDLAANDEIALRLRDAAGAEWTATDTQLAYGAYPTFMWRPGEVVPDFYRLRLPDGTPPGNYTVDISLYDPASQAALGSATVTATLTTATPRGARAAQYNLTPALGLANVTIAPHFNQGDAPELRVDWLTGAAPAAAWRARWTLVAADGTRVAQVLELAPGSPTTSWPANAFIQGRVRLGTAPDLAPGHYALDLALVDAAGQTASPDLTVAQLDVAGRPRSFTLPPLETTVGATFGGVIGLAGYDSQQTAGALQLTLVWQALSRPGRDYKFFVHLLGADGAVAAQFDAMPHNFAYPTALWVAGEVVSDTVTLPLAGAAPGTYQVAVGWYDPDHPDQRLPAAGAQGQPLADDSALLPLVVRVP
jgi:hypothetical protein